MVLIPEIRLIDFSIPISSVSSILFLVEPKRTGYWTCQRKERYSTNDGEYLPNCHDLRLDVAPKHYQHIDGVHLAHLVWADICVPWVLAAVAVAV